ncbi:hypothetical protein Taro_052155 [Colocasia esculenta]|uniref:Uncharacterized protein n=1 Tax=Colocasia esculenta TaxID=4460 RepID=A0A843XJ60_COLES|nr:hypothetical protein [Colocasia esculenta]
MEQYLEEKMASQKRPAAPFQRQERKKAAHQSPQCPTASGSRQVSSQHSPSGKKECPHCGRAHGFSREHSVERHQPQQQQERQRQDDKGDLEPQLECLCKLVRMPSRRSMSPKVDTRDLSQGIVLPVWDNVSTHLLGRSTHSGISVT